MTSALSDIKLLLPYQASAIALSAQHQLLVIEKSRRTGITYGFAADAVLTAAPAFRPQNVYYIAYNLDMTREFIGYVGDFAKAFDEVATGSSEFLFDDGSENGIKALRVDFPSGKAVIALSSKPRSLRGMQGKVLIDEAAFHDDLDELLKAAMALTMWGSHVVVISTHDGADNPFNLLIEEIREGKKEGHVMRITLAEALADGLFKRICLRNGEEWSAEKEKAWEASLRKRYGDAAEEELDVIPSRGSGVYLSRATIIAAMSPELPVIRLTCPDGFEQQSDEYRQEFVREFLEDEVGPWLRDFDPLRRSFFGQDFARNGDVSPIAAGQLDQHLNLICRFILEMRNVPFREQEFVLNWIVSRMPNFCSGKMDARGNGSALAEYAQQKWGANRIEAVMASDKSYLAFMPKLKAGLEDRTFIIPKDEGTLNDLRMVKLVKGVPKIPDGSIQSKADGAKGKRHGDNAIALMHLRAAADEDVGPMDVHVLNQTRSSAAETVITTTGFGTVGRRSTGLSF
ncbi:Mu-like prophage FluMu protein gp28 [Sphingobium faniae]|nr:Mu-like prophage FluMu protein gp28 [Sphingobium faniae]